MANPAYIHGTDSEEQERLALLNRITNHAFIDFLALRGTPSILEIGSGLGLLAEQIARLVPDGAVWGVEYFSEQLAAAKKLRQPNLHFIQGDAHRLPFKNGRFDVVYCRYVLEHVADPQRVLQDARRVLKPAGKICVQENNILALVLYPDCPRFTAVWHRFVQLQERLGGDALVGKKLLPLLKAARFRNIRLSIAPEIHAAGTSTFRPWVGNLIGNIRSGAAALQQHQLATGEEITAAVAELRTFVERDDASMFFYWNRASAIKERN
jgi:SAM-dependent methyltransferase